MKTGISAIIAAAISLMLTTTGARAEPPMDPDGASIKASALQAGHTLEGNSMR